MTSVPRRARPLRRNPAALRTGAILLMGGLFAAGAVLAIDDLELSIARIGGTGWEASGVRVQMVLEGTVPRAVVTLDELNASAVGRRLTDVRIECPHVDISVEAFACTNADVRLALAGVGAYGMRADLRYARRNADVDLKVRDLKIGQGVVELQAALHERGWRVDLAANELNLEPLLQLAQAAGAPTGGMTVSGGMISARARLHGTAGDVARGTLSARFAQITANNEAGSIASEGFGGEINLEFAREPAALEFTAALRSNAGQAYLQPFFLDLGAHALALDARGRWGGDSIALSEFTLDHRDVAQAQGRLAVDLAHEQPLRSLTLDLQRLAFPGAYRSYLQPLLLDTSFKAMSTAGEVRGEVVVEEGTPALIDLNFDDVAFDDGAKRFALTGLNGRLHWSPDSGASVADDGSVTQLRWRDGVLLGLDLGASELQLRMQGGDVALLRPARIPVLDGALQLQNLEVRDAGAPEVGFEIDARLEPISVAQLCRAFGWPEFGGRLSGEISQLQLRAGVITLGAALEAQVFDGTVRVSDLRMEEPFGEWPRLQASIGIANLDLELVTRAFSFGRITGRLSGRIADLRLFNWTPIAFDAQLQTPPDDRSRHRISQRAVQNIGSIGGGGAGVTAALSSGFLRFFDDFNYRRLGVSCRLENEVCYMGGVAPAPNGGYYLVQGAGLPRIDVIGDARRVDWPRLVQQLSAIAESEGPVVR